MMQRVHTAILCVFLAEMALATTCTQPDDWVPQLCDLKIAAETRCAIMADNMIARNACAPQTDGCAAIGGCFGFVPPSHWWPIMDGGESKRCVCGCFAEETSFLAESGNVTGRDLIDGAKKPNTPYSSEKQRILGLSALNSKNLQDFEINGVVYGREQKPVYFVTTTLGRSVTLSEQHPVLVVDENGSFAAVKTVANIVAGEHVLTDDGRIDTVISVLTKDYQNRMVNFNVMSRDPANHFVAAGGLILGDNAWQQRLASTEARILQRSDLLQAMQNERSHQ